jgi:hypothetical protein
LSKEEQKRLLPTGRKRTQLEISVGDLKERDRWMIICIIMKRQLIIQFRICAMVCCSADDKEMVIL